MKTSRRTLFSAHSPSNSTSGSRPWTLTKEAFPYLQAIALAVALVGFFLRFHIKNSYREQILSWQARLTGVADVQAQRVSEWLKERQGDAKDSSIRPSIAAVLRAYDQSGRLPKISSDSRAESSAALDAMATSYSYVGVYILDRDAHLVMQSSHSTPLSPLFAESCRAVARSGVALEELAGDTPTRTLMGFIAPVFPEHTSAGPARSTGQPLGAVLLVSDASQTLFPLVTREVIPSRTGETVLVRREGDRIVYFSPLRHISSGSPSLWFPLSAAPIPAKHALEGRTAFAEFNDYRGVPVLAATQNIPLTAWGLVRKIDRAEALEDFHHVAMLEGLAAGLLIILLGGMLLLLHNHIVTRVRKREEERFRAVVESAPDAIYILEPSTLRILGRNLRAVELDGYTDEEAAHMTAADLHPPEDHNLLRESFHKASETGGSLPIDTLHHRRKDGLLVPVEESQTLVNAGDETLILSIVRDITGRKRAELALRESEARLQFALETSQMGEWDLNIVDHTASRSLRHDRIFGYETLLPEWTYEKFMEHVVPEDRELVDRKFRQAMEARCEWNFQCRIVRRDQAVRWIWARGRPRSDVDGKFKWLAGIVEDITERKLAEEALIEERRLLHSLMDNLPDRIYFKDRESHFTRINKAHAEQFGLSDPAQAVGKTDFDYFPEERARRASNEEKEIIRTGQPIVDRESRADWPDGHVTWFVTTKMPLRDPNGSSIGTFGVSHDITKRKLAEEALSESEGRYRSLVSNIPDVAWTLDANLRFVFISNNIERMSGFSVDEIYDSGTELFLQSIHPDDVLKVKDGIQALFAEGRPYDVECRVRRKDGEWIWVHDRAVATYEKNDIRYADGLLSNITERKRAEETVLESRAKLDAALASITDAVFICDTKGLFVDFNDAFATYHRFKNKDECLKTLAEYPGILDVSMANGEPAPLDQWASPRALRGETGTNAEYRLRRKDTGETWFGSYSFGPIRDKNGVIVGAVVTGRDITEQKRAEQELYQSRQMLESILNTIPQRVFWKDRNTFYLGCNKALAIDAGLKDPTEIIGKNDSELIWRETAESYRADDELVMKQDNPRLNYEETQNRPDGSVIWLRTSKLPLHDQEGKVIGIIGTYEDITEQKLAEAEHVRLVTAIEQSAEAVVITDPSGTIEYVNPAFTIITGYSREEILGQNPRILKSGTQDAEFYQQLWGTIVSGRSWQGELTNRRKDGSLYTEHMSITPVRGERGEVAHFIATKQNVTERKNLEAQLHQASKMEAVGTLAGGVAHDFNNLLTIINGYSEILLEKLAADVKSSSYLKEISDAGERAASLTRQLLAFSRRQVLTPQVLDLNAVVSNLEKMLRRLIGEDIELHALLSPSLAQVKADPGQIEQVIMNLAVNARDAMPMGGSLAIETSNVELDEDYARNHPTVKPGPHVMLVVSDTGVGITPETQARIFEPFFTTKEMGKGTGLGLATVYGIVKQSGGSVWVYSEVGEGTTFKLYSPVVTDGSAVGEPLQFQPDSGMGTETILVVEDEEGVRSLVRLALISGGYKVLEAPNAESAMALCSSHDAPIHLLLTDVVMPQMSGPEVASKVAALRPGIKVLYMSGYTDDAVVHHGVLALDMPFIQKPFSPVSLRKKIREVLSGNTR